jgi:hypothetical protein
MGVVSSTVAPAASGSPKSLYGRVFGLGTTGATQGGTTGVNLTNPCVNASIDVTVGDDAGTIAIQLKDANGADINYVETVMVVLDTSAARTAFATTGGSTGLAIGTDGALLALVNKKVFLVTSEDDGDIDFTWTDTGTETVALALYLPNGNVVTTAAFANT